MKTFTSLVSLLASGSLFAQSGPDVIWATNANVNYGINAVSISGNGSFVVAAVGNETVAVWNSTNAALVRVLSISGADVRSAALSQAGDLVVAGDAGGKTRVWQVSDGVRLWIGGPDNQIVYSVSFATDDTLLAIARHGINIRYAQSGTGIPFTGLSEEIYQATFSRVDNTLASANADGTASLWNVYSNTLVRSFVGHSNEVHSVDFSPDGTRLATASADGTARIWNVTNGAQLVVMDGGGGVGKFSADGKYLFTLNDGTFKIWRATSGACVGSITNSGALVFDIAKNGKYFTYGTSAGTVVLARIPLLLDQVTRTGNQTVLKWQGGSGLYQLQSCTNFSNDVWQNVGSVTTNTSATNITSSTVFFRVQSLPNP